MERCNEVLSTSRQIQRLMTDLQCQDLAALHDESYASFAHLCHREGWLISKSSNVEKEFHVSAVYVFQSKQLYTHCTHEAIFCTGMQMM